MRSRDRQLLLNSATVRLVQHEQEAGPDRLIVKVPREEYVALLHAAGDPEVIETVNDGMMRAAAAGGLLLGLLLGFYLARKLAAAD
jgi:hypothetical protein